MNAIVIGAGIVGLATARALDELAARVMESVQCKIDHFLA